MTTDDRQPSDSAIPQAPVTSPVSAGKNPGRGQITAPQWVPEIQLEEMLTSPAAVVVDVRAGKEFAEDHYPGAFSVPLFDDRERAVVGTLYRHVGSKEAREWGEQRVLERLATFRQDLERALQWVPGAPSDGKLRVIVCARGGLRSQAVTLLLRGYGHEVSRLSGGYRSYRQWVRQQMLNYEIPQPIVLHGLTGVGKTRILRRIAESFPNRVLDLEGIAGHRSSLLGDVGLQPVSQKTFESQLAQRGQDLVEPWTLVEWEARKIGNRELPTSIYKACANGVHLLVEASMASRVDLLCDEYLAIGGIEPLIDRMQSLRHFSNFGDKGIHQLTLLLREGDTKEVARRLLEVHYDPRYHHSQDQFEYQECFHLSNIDSTSTEIINWIENNI